MNDRKLMLALVAGSFCLRSLGADAPEVAAVAAAQPAPRDEIAPLSQRSSTLSVTPNLKVSALMGMTVRNDTGERLGKLEDIIVNMDSHTVPFAIVERGGALGLGGIRVAVPLADLRWTRDPGQLILTATREQWEAAGTSPTGGWLALAGEGWVKNVDRYYGDPSVAGPEPSATTPPRPVVGGSQKDLRAPNGQAEQPLSDPGGKHEVATPTDEYLMGKINTVIRQDVGGDASKNVQVTLKEGLVTLKGRVPSEAQRKLVGNQIKAIGGVDRVQNELSVGSY